jgi:hypothetical protein
MADGQGAQVGLEFQDGKTGTDAGEAERIHLLAGSCEPVPEVGWMETNGSDYCNTNLIQMC